MEVEVRISGRRQRKHLKKTCLGCDNEDVISFWLSQGSVQSEAKSCRHLASPGHMGNGH